MVSKASLSPAQAAISSRKVSAWVNGTSPDSTTTMPSSGRAGTACCTAWPVPSCGSWRTNCSSPPAGRATPASTSAAPWPVITTTRRAFKPLAVSTTCCNNGRPAKRCNTLGSLLFMRVPLPAAMMTTSTACPFCFMRLSIVMVNFRPLPAFLTRIIGALLLVLLTGCSAIRLGYNNAASLSYWWLDGYIDFTDAQAQPVRDRLAALHAWHRQRELPALADLVQQMQTLAAGDVTPQQVCALTDPIRQHLRRLVAQVAESMAPIVPTLQTEQLEHLAEQFEKHNQKWREEWLDGTTAELQE